MGDVWAHLQETASLLEVVWTLPAAVGVLRYLRRYLVAMQDQRQLLHDPSIRMLDITEADLIANISRCFRFGCLTVAFGGMLVAGLCAMWLPPNPAVVDAQPGETLAVISAAALFVVQAALIVKGEVEDWLERQMGMLHDLQRRHLKRLGE